MQPILIEALPKQALFEGATEYVLMTWEQRRKPRSKYKTNAGREINIALPRGTTLADGTLLHWENGRGILVKAQPESVYVIKPSNQHQACIAAHHIGNWHRSMQLTDAGELIVEADGPLGQWLEKSGIEHSAQQRVFQPHISVSGHD